MKNIVVGTAGHVDHGKTTLVKALTGVDTDRLLEEKKRGITIEVGFARHQLPSGQILSFVDVPGHEKFIKNMLRGISGVDIALLVIAADDGVMPQTREHLDILNLLAVKHGVIVITKIDLVDEQLLSIAAEEVKNLVSGTFLDHAPVLYFSAKTGSGIEEINQSLESLSQHVRERDQEANFRLPIDRVFSMAGYGTVVTGTIASGKVRVGDELEVYPSQKGVRVRDIQAHHQRVDHAQAGQRVGINLPQVSVNELVRGMVLGAFDSLLPTHLFNGRFYYLSSAHGHLHNKVKVKFFTGTTEAVGRIIFMGKEKVLPGENALVQFRLEKPIVASGGDRYIIRNLSPIQTIGGGVLLEVNPLKYRAFDSELLEFLKLLEQEAYPEALEWIIHKKKYRLLESRSVEQKFGLKKKVVDSVLDELERKGKLLFIDRKFMIHRRWYDALSDEIQKELRKFHEKNPLQGSISQEELRARVSSDLNPRLGEVIFHELVQKNIITIKHGGVSLTGQSISVTPEQKVILDRVEKMCRDSWLESLRWEEVKEAFNGKKDSEINSLLKVMVAKNQLIKLKENRFIHEEALEEVKKKIKAYVQVHGKITAAECKSLLGLGRKETIRILEYFDDLKFTLRIGDHRVLLKGN